MTRKDRLKELGIKPWAFYEAKQVYLRDEKRDGACAEGEFIQLTSGRYVPASVTEAEMAANPGKRPRATESAQAIEIECRTVRGGMIRIRGPLSDLMLSTLLQNL